MNYYYDLNLDFLENNYSFYEVEKDDNFQIIKKIPLFQVDNKTLKDFILYNITVEAPFLDLIKNKTITNEKTLEYATILADKNTALAFIFDQAGNIIKYSPLALKEELNLLEIIYNVKKITIAYVKKKKIQNKFPNRHLEKIKKTITQEINNLFHENNLVKLQFLYLEWCDKFENDINKIYHDLSSAMQKDIGWKEEKIFKIIEMSYNNV